MLHHLFKKFRLGLFVCFTLFAATACQQTTSSQEYPQLRVVIIRHGEKPEKGDNLSCRGFNRSLQLPEVLFNKFGQADYVYVPDLKEGKETTSSRMYQTIVPYAVKYNLNINTQYAVGDEQTLAKNILKKSGTVIVVWEHNGITQVAKALGVSSKKLKWKSDDFDSIWIVSFDKDGNAQLTRDKENINPDNDCK